MGILGWTDEYNDFAPLLARYRDALVTLGTWGVGIAPNSRLRAYERRLAEAAQDPQPWVTEAFAAQLIVDLREIDEVVTIVESFAAPPTADELILLNKLAAGTDHPDDEKGAPAREAQYELALRALLLNRGVAVVVGNPDLTITHGGKTYPLEAKRPGSPDRFDDRLREGISQLQRHAEPGIVAISLDQVVRPRDKYLTVPSRELVGPAVAGLVRGFVEQNRYAVARRVEGKRVAAILLTACLPARSTDTGLSLMGTNNHIEAIAATGAPGAAIVEHLMAAFSAESAEGAS